VFFPVCQPIRKHQILLINVCSCHVAGIYFDVRWYSYPVAQQIMNPDPQQPSKTPRTDAEFAETVNRNPLTGLGGEWYLRCQQMLKLSKQLETELSTANAEVESLKELISCYRYAVEFYPHDAGYRANKLLTGTSIKGELIEQRDALLENSKALAEVIRHSDNEVHLRMFAEHSKLMEQFTSLTSAPHKSSPSSAKL
jgi:hypothetical protein